MVLHETEKREQNSWAEQAQHDFEGIRANMDHYVLVDELAANFHSYPTKLGQLDLGVPFQGPSDREHAGAAFRYKAKMAYIATLIATLQAAINTQTRRNLLADLSLSQLELPAKYPNDTEFFQAQAEAAQGEALAVLFYNLGLREQVARVPFVTKKIAQKIGILPHTKSSFSIQSRIRGIAVEYEYGEEEKPVAIFVVPR